MISPSCEYPAKFTEANYLIDMLIKLQLVITDLILNSYFGEPNRCQKCPPKNQGSHGQISAGLVSVLKAIMMM